MNSELAIGFATEDCSWHLLSHLFPDKIGGRPAWLALKYLPEPSALKCSICSESMVFVLQVSEIDFYILKKIYSPISSRDDCFHRFIYLFMCRKGDCHINKEHLPFAVFRSQLSRKNDYYRYIDTVFTIVTVYLII